LVDAAVIGDELSAERAEGAELHGGDLAALSPGATGSGAAHRWLPDAV